MYISGYFSCIFTVVYRCQFTFVHSLCYYHCFFCELFCMLYYGCSLCAFLPAALVVFMMLFAIAGAQWRIPSADCATACSAAGTAEALKVRPFVRR